MSFTKITKELLNQTLTENGDKAYVSTLSPCLDYFSLIGGKRERIPECVSLFAKAFFEDENTALKLLFYTRDVRNGLGERRIFRFLLNSLAISYPEKAAKLVPYVAKYGRYDDLLALLYTPIEDAVIELISAQLEEDLENKRAGKSISLLAKWLPSINTSNAEVRALACHLADRLNLSKADYRKTLSYLRKGLIVENNLREKQYDFDYEKVPSMAMNKYRKAFSRNDNERFYSYLEGVKSGKKTMHTDILDVVTFIKRVKSSIENRDMGPEYYETTWDSLIKGAGINKRTLVVRDGSGSMYWYGTGTQPIDIADAMTLLTAARLEGEFHDKFITFSSKPEFVDLSDKGDLFKKCEYLKTFDDCSNTNIQKVYELIINIYKHPDFKKEDALDQILIISDMEFDAIDIPTLDGMSTFEYFKHRFEKLGFKMPEIIFWNVDARGKKVPVTQNEVGVKLVSGSSKNVIDLVTTVESIDPLDFMNKVLENYKFIDNLFPKE